MSFRGAGRQSYHLFCGQSQASCPVFLLSLANPSLTVASYLLLRHESGKANKHIPH